MSLAWVGSDRQGALVLRVLVTGHRGYLGAVLVSVLQNQRFDLTGLDNNWFDGCDFGRTHCEVPAYQLDIRDVQFADLLSFDAVVHLAGLSDDACADLDPVCADGINHAATVRLAELCRQARVSKFIFASSCAVYGRSDRRWRTEKDSPSAVSVYAQGKLAAERQILRMADETFAPTVLRFGTLYGLSPRLRVDTFVNEFAASALASGRVVMRSAGSAWRPVVHVEDAARAIGAVLRARSESVTSRIFNVADTRENHRVVDVADRVCEAAGVTKQLGRPTFDERSYRVDGSHFLEQLPGFGFRWSLDRGIRQLLSGLSNAGFTSSDLRGDRFRRVLRLRSLLEHHRLNPDLRVIDAMAAA